MHFEANNQNFTRVDGNEELHFQLWYVSYWCPRAKEFRDWVHVLAPTREAAISQAGCLGGKGSTYIESHMSEMNEKSVCERVPFLIRGWGANLF